MRSSNFMSIRVKSSYVSMRNNFCMQTNCNAQCENEKKNTRIIIARKQVQHKARIILTCFFLICLHGNENFVPVREQINSHHWLFSRIEYIMILKFKKIIPTWFCGVGNVINLENILNIYSHFTNKRIMYTLFQNYGIYI